MRRGLVAILATAAVVALAACGSSGGGGGGKKQLALVAGVKGDEFYITMNCGAQAEAKKKGVDLSFQGPNEFDASLQTPVVNAVAAKRPDAILVAPTDTKAMYAPLKQAAQNSKIVLVDTTLDDPSLAESQIASNNLAGGQAAGKELGRLIGGSGEVLVTNVKPGISTTDQRQQGFEQAVKGQPGIDYIGTQYNNDDPAKAASIVTATLAKHPNLKGIFATNLFGAEGAAAGLRQAGKLGQVKIIGFDAGPKQVSDLKSGVVQALIAQKPAEIGADGVDQAINALDGKPVTKKIGTGFVVVTKKNVDDPAVSKYLYKSDCGTQ